MQFSSITNKLSLFSRFAIGCVITLSIFLGFETEALAAYEVDINLDTELLGVVSEVQAGRDASVIPDEFYASAVLSNRESADNSSMKSKNRDQEMGTCNLSTAESLHEAQSLYAAGKGVCYGYEKDDGTCGVKANNCVEGSPVVPEFPPCGCRCED